MPLTPAGGRRTLSAAARRRPLVLALGAALAPLAVGCTPSVQAKPVAPGFHRLTIAGHTLDVEIAADPSRRQTGLMYREKLPEDGGMLFIFPQAQMQGFWMNNCLIDLDIAYIDDDGSIVEVLRMKVPDKEHPNVLPRYRSSRAVRYALETNAGWFERKGIGAGAKVEGYRGPAGIAPN